MPAKIFDAIVIGAGISGIAAAYHLRRAGLSCRVLEKRGAVGGIWASQDWPGLRCDSEFFTYGFSFEPWLANSLLMTGTQIRSYIETTVEKHSIGPLICFHTTVEEASFDSQACTWTLATDNGEYRCRFLFNTNGYFSDTPHIPEFPGVEEFGGTVGHLAERNSDLKEYFGKSVVLIGSGASAISSAPVLAGAAGKMTLLQRTPSYIFEEKNRPNKFERFAMALQKRGIHWTYRAAINLRTLRKDAIYLLCKLWPSSVQWFFRRQWLSAVNLETYRMHFSPPYLPWDQRICRSLGFVPCVAAGEINIVTSEIESFDVTGILLKDGRHVEADVVLFATGYDLSLLKFRLSVDGVSVRYAKLNYYKALMLGDVPNYFQPFGVPHNSWTPRIELALRLAVKIIAYMRRNGLDTVSIPRTDIPQKPRITPNYLVRCLETLPAIYGCFELGIPDQILAFRFWSRSYRFGMMSEKVDRAGRGTLGVDIPEILTADKTT